jgi:two-component system phosphate regulon sensor histidine kinase PhoR
MATGDLDRLAALIEGGRDALLARWRRQVRELPAARHLDVPTLNDHIPGLLDELVAALQSPSGQTIPEELAEGSAPAHGLQRLKDAFDIEEVVAEYNILRGCIHDLAEAEGVNLQGKPFHTVNRVLSHAIGSALQAYATERALEVQRRREEYLSFVAHDLRNPLFAISLAGRVLELKTKDRGLDSATGRMLKALRRNVRHLEALVEKVLQENANLESEDGVRLERREIDLWPVVEALVHDLRQVAGTGGTELLNEVPDDMVAFADAGLLRRILQNLIANAIRYTPRGAVTIGARGLGTGGAVECTVGDDGAGIPDDLVARVFDKGVTDPETEGGAGLGLAIVKTFVEAHGGDVTVESRLGAGTTFRFSLPGRGGAGG